MEGRRETNSIVIGKIKENVSVLSPFPLLPPFFDLDKNSILNITYIKTLCLLL